MPMENDPSIDPKLIQLLAVKRLESPPPGFYDYLRGRVMRTISMERERLARPWWYRMFEEVTWQRGMAAANMVALAGVGVLAIATFHVAHSVANEEEEGQVYAAIPLPPEVLHRASAADSGSDTLIATVDDPAPYQPMPSTGTTAPIRAGFTLSPSATETSEPPPKWLFKPAVGFHLASDRDRR